MLSFWRTSISALGFCACAALCSGAVIPNDFYYSQYQWYSNTIGMPEAWSISTGSPSVAVAVLDTGVISTTEDLVGRLLSPLSVVGVQPPSTDEWMMDLTQTDQRRHGTWVASTAAMGVNNGIGGAGVGNFSVLPIRVSGAYVTTQPTWLANGIRLAADNGAKVINISWSVSNYEQLDDAAAYARSKGALTFVGAGNTNGYRDLADYANLIFVSGTNPDDDRWSEGSVGSSYGTFVDISAPAQDILVADPTTPNGYGLNSGTSFATPLAAGAAALAWSINPNLTPDQVEQMLYSTADDLGTAGRDQFFGWGRINVGALAQAALATVPEPSVWVMFFAGAAMFLWLRNKSSSR